MKTKSVMIAFLCAAGIANAAYVTIGDPGNAADPANGGIYGDVGYTYQISKRSDDCGVFSIYNCYWSRR